MAARKTALEKKLDEAVKLLERNGYTITPPAVPIKVDATELNKRKLEARRQAFIEELRKYQGKYSNDLLNMFFTYWSEANKSFTKMRFEMQKTFQIDLRLKTWYNNDRKRYGSRQIPTDAERINKLSDILAG